MSWLSDTLEDVDSWLGGGNYSGGGDDWWGSNSDAVDEGDYYYPPWDYDISLGETPMSIDMLTSSQNDSFYSYDGGGDGVRGDPRMFADEGERLSTTQFAHEYYDPRSYAKQGKDYLFNLAKELGIDPDVLKALGDFAGAAFPKGGKEGDGSRSSKLAQKRSPRGSGSQGRPISGPGRTAAAILAKSRQAQKGVEALRRASKENPAIRHNQLLAAVTGETATRSKTIPLSDTLRQMPNLQPPRTIA